MSVENLNFDGNTRVDNIKEDSKQNEISKITHRSDDELNKTSLLDSNSNFNDEESSTSAPVEILSEFLSSFMSRDYRSALHYCKLILQYEPDNEIVRDFYPLLLEKIDQNSSESDEFADSEASSFGTKSESSTEYFSSAFSGAENNSASSCFSSDEEEFSAVSSE